MEFATGALGTLLPKLGQLLEDEYNLHKGAKKNIEFLTRELKSVHAALRVVGEVPREGLSDLVKVWAHDAREVSYDMEDIVDTFLVRVQDPAKLPSKRSAKKFINKMMGFVTKAKTRHDMGQEIKDIKERVKEIAKRRDRYKVDVAIPAKTSVDPRIAALYNKVADLVGIDEASEELIKRLTKDDDKSPQQTILSVVGFGGLGKTTLAKAVYDKLKGQFDCTAFVPVGRNPDLKKVLKAISIDLGMHINFEILDERQLIDRLREFLEYKRYFLVIDDVWETESWEIIKLAFIENDRASKIIATTRNHEVARKAGEVYNQKPLSDDYSRQLFFARIFGSESKSPNQQPDDDVSNKILKKCGGIPLAIITMASLLVGKPMEEWSEVHQSIGFANKENQQVENTEKIISFSYYDLPSHLRTCLLYISMFPEDYFIEKSILVGMWVAEGFIQEKQGMSSFEIGEGYFNELVNRSMIQMAEKEDRYMHGFMQCGCGELHDPYMYGTTCGCRVHDMVLDLIRSISSEQNFVTILDKNEGASSSSSSQGKVRRLALQNDITLKTNMEIQQVRSFISWEWDVDKGISLRNFKLVRVLALHSTSYSYSSNLEVPFRNLLHLRYLRLSATARIVFPAAEEIGTLKFLQTMDVGRDELTTLVVTTSASLPTELVCLRFRSYIKTVPDGIGKLTSLEELQMCYTGPEEEPWRRFVRELCGLTELRVLRLAMPEWSRDIREVQNDMVQFLCNLQKLEILSLTISCGFVDPVEGFGTGVCQAPEGFLLSRRLRILSVDWIIFSRFPSLCINPSRLPNLTHLSLHVEADMDEQDLRILGGLPQLRFLHLAVCSIAEVDCTNTRRIDNDGCCLFQKLRRCTIRYSGIRFLLPSHEGDSGSVSFRVQYLRALLLVPEREDTVCNKAAGVTLTLIPSAQNFFIVVEVQEFIKDLSNPDDDRIRLAFEYFASLQNVKVHIDCDDDSTTAEVERVKAALRRAFDVHPNRPTHIVQRSRVRPNEAE